MTPFFALCRKLLGESRWLLGLTAAALFAVSWLTVYVTARLEGQVRSALASGQSGPRMRLVRALGGSAMDFSTTAIELAWWNHPFVVLSVVVWAIARGSIAVAGEIERGTLDLTLSRPVARTSYLAAHVLTALLGLAVLAAALIAGNLVGTRYNRVESPPTALVLSRPALNLAALGLAIYGATLLFSARDLVRWRPNLLAAVLTLASFVLLAIVNAPSMEDYKWLEQFSIFKAYNPVEAGVKGENLAFNVGVLAGVGGTGIALALLVFAWRDLPASGG